MWVFTVKMSSVQLEREFINEQLTAVEETFTEIKEIIVKEEEMDEQHRLLDFSRTSQTLLHGKGINTGDAKVLMPTAILMVFL